MKRLRNFWDGWKAELAFGKNALIGLVAATLIGILLTIWGIVAPTILLWTPLLQNLTVFQNTSVFLLNIISAFLWLVPLAYGFGLTLRLPGIFAQRAARDLKRALRIGLFLQRHRFFAWFWRKLIQTSVLATVFENLTPVMVPFMDGEYIGLVTHVGRERYHDGCPAEQRRVCSLEDRSERCTTFLYGKYKFVVYLGDWPMIIIGRPLWYSVRDTQLILASVRRAFGWIASLGLTADKHLDIKRFSDEDIELLEAELRENEELLLVSGLNDAQEIERQKLESGELDPNWRNQ